MKGLVILMLFMLVVSAILWIVLAGMVWHSHKTKNTSALVAWSILSISWTIIAWNLFLHP